MDAGFSSNTDNPQYSVEDEANKLTIEEMNRSVRTITAWRAK